MWFRAHVTPPPPPSPIVAGNGGQLVSFGAPVPEGEKLVVDGKKVGGCNGALGRAAAMVPHCCVY